MIEIRRLLAVAGVLAAAAIISTSVVWGVSERDKEEKTWRAGDGKFINPQDSSGRSAEELERSRFADQTMVVYQPEGGEALFGLQVRPTLDKPADLPRDYLVIVDTSASKAQGPMTIALQIALQLSEYLKKERPNDRMAIWTANIKPKDVSRGFRAPGDLENVFTELTREVPLGAVSLKKCLSEAVASFDARANRQRVVIYLGDGSSVAEAIDADDRAELCEQMIKKQAPFYAVPLGIRIDSQNLHSLVSGTGGKVVRCVLGDTPEVFMPRLLGAVSEPVFYPEQFRLNDGIKDILPSKLPPLRRDQATLVVGKLPAGLKTVQLQLTGEVGGKVVRVEQTFKVPASDEDNFFLTNIAEQWKVRKDRPALLPADRALAYAHKQHQLAVEELLARGEYALEQDQLDAAHRAFEQAQQLAPRSARARGGLVLVDKMRTGKKTRQDMLKELQLNAAKREVVRLGKDGKWNIVVLDDGDEKKEEPANPEQKLLDDVKARRAIVEQQTNAMVNEAIRQASRLVRNNPDEAYESLKRTLEGVRGNVDLEPATINSLTTRLSRAMESVKRQGDIIKRDQAEALALRAAADARLDLRNAERLAQDRVRERMRVYRNLMDQAREQEAQKQMEAARTELVNRGLPVPQSVTSGYIVAENRYYLREAQELRRIREERFLATLLEVERSHIPFPDEPPVEYPSAAVLRRMTRGRYDNWRDFSKNRIERYAVSTFGSDNPAQLNAVRDLLNTRINYGGLEDKVKLIEVLQQLKSGILSKLPGGRDVEFDINDKAFKVEQFPGNVAETEIAPPPIPPLENVTLKTVLTRILARIPSASGATYVIRPGTIEITTGQMAAAEKAIRVYPVADLVTPIPNAFNTMAVSQVGSILGTIGMAGLAAGGLALGGLGALGIGGLALGALGGGLGALGAVGGLGALGAVGGLGALGAAGLGALGAAGLGAGALGQVGALGAAGAQIGGFNFQGNVNLGVGGGALGFTGGQLGQLGNLGGQFGAQGGDQSQLLITLIRQVVGRPRDWAPQYNPITGQPLNPLDDQNPDAPQISGENNNLGYFPPSLALVVKAPSTIHTKPFNVIIQNAPGGGMASINPGGIRVNGKPGELQVADANAERNKGLSDPKLDPRKIWQEALLKGLNDPTMIIDTADLLAQAAHFDHAAEFLKANLRQGVMVQPWVYKTLAIALRQSGGSAEEIERAEVSAADLEPLDSTGYLLAARALAEDKNYERALAFCKQAAQIEPNVPHAYADAARYSEMAKDVQSMQWAVSHLLRQDWPVRNAELQQTAIEKLESLARQLDPEKAAQLRSAVNSQRRRDVVIKLLYQGEADLDLKVLEPTGSFASTLTRQTINGGTLIADSVLGGLNSETYVAAEAFSGEYTVTVERIWGKPLGNKAQLKIIRHQGTPQESEQLITLQMNSNISEPIRFTLENGRRTETAYVPPPAAYQSLEEKVPALDSSEQVLTKLRDLADPEVTGFERGVYGNTASPGVPTAREPRPIVKPSANDRTLYQTRVSSFVANTLELTAQAVLTADRRSLRLDISTVNNPAAATRPPRVISPIFPGAGK